MSALSSRGKKMEGREDAEGDEKRKWLLLLRSRVTSTPLTRKTFPWNLVPDSASTEKIPIYFCSEFIRQLVNMQRH